MQKIQQSIEERTSALQQHHKDMEGKLLEDIKEFGNELTRVKNEIDAFKDNQSMKQYEEYLRKLNDLNNSIKELGERMEVINKAGQDLEFGVPEFPFLEQCKKNI